VSPGLTLLAAISCFLILNGPSVKLFYSSELVNIVAVGSLIYLGVIHVLVQRSVSVGRTALLVTALNLLLWGLLYLSVVWGQHTTITVELFLRYLGSVFAITAIAVFLQPGSARQLTWLQAGWGSVLAAFYLLGVIGLYHIPGQHYLTLGVPVAAAVLSSIGLLLARPRPAVLVQLLLAGNVLLCFIVLAGLLGRSPILFSVAVLSVTAVIYVLTARTFLRRLSGVLALVAVFSAAVALSTRLLEERWIERFERLASNVQAEPRYDIYTESANLISTMPLGFGPGASFDLVGFYPHNIFLEVMLSAGIWAALPLLALCWMVFSRFVTAVHRRTRHLALGMVALYMLMTWNVSFDLGTAYVPLGFAAAAIVAISRGDRGENFGRARNAQSSAAAAAGPAERDGTDSSA
jgi:O-antigen ligase